MHCLSCAALEAHGLQPVTYACCAGLRVGDQIRQYQISASHTRLTRCLTLRVHLMHARLDIPGNSIQKGVHLGWGSRQGR